MVVVVVGATFRGSNPNVVVAPGVRPGPDGEVVPDVVGAGPNPNGSGGGAPPPGVVLGGGVPVPLPDPFDPDFDDPLPVWLPVPDGSSVAAWFAELTPDLLPVPVPPLVVPGVAPDPVVPVPLPNPPNPVPVCAGATCVQTHPTRRIWSQGRANFIAEFVV